MKKAFLLLGVLFLLILVSPIPTAAAPQVSVKTVVTPGTIGVGLEAGFPIGSSGHWSLMTQSGWIYEGIGVGVGVRYYLNPGPWRFYTSGYLCAVLQFSSFNLVPVLAGTAGLEYRAPGGLIVAAEAGLGLAVYVPLWGLGLAVGYQF